MLLAANGGGAAGHGVPLAGATVGEGGDRGGRGHGGAGGYLRVWLFSLCLRVSYVFPLSLLCFTTCI